MLRLLCVCISLLMANAVNAQSGTLDFSNAPGQTSLISTKKSNASLLKESGQPATGSVNDTNLSEKYKVDADNLSNGTFRTVAVPNAGTSIMEEQPQMMNATFNQSQLGNMKVNSSTYYDDNGRMRGTTTTIDLGGRK